VRGGGVLSGLVACSTGQISANWQLTEPAADVATFTAGGVIVGGVAVLAGAPPSGYVDGPAATPGAGVGVGVFLPKLGQTCVSTVTAFDVTAVVVGAY
jgi:hypothetical protein